MKGESCETIGQPNGGEEGQLMRRPAGWDGLPSVIVDLSVLPASPVQSIAHRNLDRHARLS